MSKMVQEYLEAVLPGVFKFATSRAIGVIKRSKHNKFKINRKLFEKEVICSRLVGELAGLERVLTYIENNQVDSIDDIIGFCQVGVMSTNNCINQLSGGSHHVEIEDFFNGNLSYKAAEELNEGSSQMDKRENQMPCS